MVRIYDKTSSDYLYGYVYDKIYYFMHCKPLTFICNKSFLEGTFPEWMKKRK